MVLEIAGFTIRSGEEDPPVEYAMDISSGTDCRWRAENPLRRWGRRGTG